MLEPNTFYHIYNRANGWEKLFLERRNFQYFINKYAMYLSPVADTYSWCLMPNHFHFLIKTKSRDEVLMKFPELKKITDDEALQGLIQRQYSKQFGKLFSCYAQSYNKVHHRMGGLFMKSFKLKAVYDDDYLHRLVFYIHANPVHHGYKKRIQDWEFSSFHLLTSNEATYLKREELLGWFGGEEGFKAFLDRPIQLKNTEEFEE
jgi:putative transposase